MSSVFASLRLPSPELVRANWRAGIAIAFISVPLSVAISIASGAGPLPGIITGIVGTLVASLFCSNNFNVIGAAGALTTVLFAAALSSPLGLGAAVLPILAITSGVLLLGIWAIRADELLYYVPSSVMYGFSAGVAILIAASQLFDATGLSALKRTGSFTGDISLFIEHASQTQTAAIAVFAAFLVFILAWKRFLPAFPAIIPSAVLGIAFGIVEAQVPGLDLVSLGDKFGQITGALALPVAWSGFVQLLSDLESLSWVLRTSLLIALIALLETLITARLADTLTKTQSSARREIFGLALANIASGAAGGLPATGVFIRTGANIKAGATHRTAATIAAVATAGIALLVMPLFVYIPMAVIAAMLVNTALGLIETETFRQFWERERSSFGIAILVAVITVLHDAGLAVGVGAVLALLIFAHQVSRGRFDVIYNFADGSVETLHGMHHIHVPEGREITVVNYSIAGFLGYIESGQHAANFRHIAHARNVQAVIIRLRDLFGIDYEGAEALVESVRDLQSRGKRVYISSASDVVAAHLKTRLDPAILADKTEYALRDCGIVPHNERRFFEKHIRKDCA